MAKYTQQPPLQEPVPGLQLLSKLLVEGAVQFQEALANGNPIAVATIGVVSFFLLTVAARCTYSLRSSLPNVKKSNRRRRKAGGGTNNTSPVSLENFPVSARQPKRRKGDSQTPASRFAAATTAQVEQPMEAVDAHESEDDGGGEWLVVSSKKKPKPKRA